MRAIRSLIAVLGQSARTIEQRSGVTNAQLFVLQLLADDVPHSINEIASLALTHQSAVSVIVSRLERAGLVRRTRSRADARRVDVSTTPVGRKIARKALPDAELRQLGASLGKILAERGTRPDEEPMMLFEPKARSRTTKTHPPR